MRHLFRQGVRYERGIRSVPRTARPGRMGLPWRLQLGLLHPRPAIMQLPHV